MSLLILFLLPSLYSPEVIHPNISSSRVYEFKPLTTGDLWTVVSNFGCFGDPNASGTGNPSYDWPGTEGYYYLWEGKLWVGTNYDGTPYVSHCDYGNYEWEDEGWIFEGPEKSDYDIVSAYHDWGTYNTGRAIGIKIIQRALSWQDFPAEHIIVYEFDVIYNASYSDIGAPSTLDSFYFSICFDADISEVDPTNCHLDDLVCYDGWTGGEWDTLIHFPSPTDDYTIKQDTTLDIPDGIPDQICLFGDDPNENTLLGDTQRIWRDMSFMLDGDDPSSPANDSTESDSAAGFIFGSMLYAPESPNDSTWLDTYNDTCRLIRPKSHQWWDWNNDPGTDSYKFAYMTGTHSFSQGYKFLPHPFDWGKDVFDYRFLLTYGPYSIADGDTIRFVLATGIGQGLNGGEDTVYNRGYLLGARQLSDYALMMYYTGSTVSDPYHPSNPVEDIHWGYTGVEENTITKVALTVKNSIITNGLLSMELQLKENSRIKVKIYDKTGRMLRKLSKVYDSGRKTLILPLDHLPPDVYFIRGEINEKVICKEKLVLIK